ncbi:DUF2690 domain-containing protein [Streptomyces sp. SP17BM10]|uniref:helix-turn-helix domain-containing protein n=1 Tax=Streptomyces sp. SP17BM10 TaxID=3002530 RepID=UPI002E78FABE|nr:DUF2690 domain-containing protein [Streptomyces sp. SP17BM10]MEE1788416.1 DUF2690 domain-containing protein [Streptomyces sp. SP17BM10]
MVGDWRALPARLGPQERELVVGLRALKDGSGLTLAELAAKTHYSKSSWHRWLNGERVVTQAALAAFGALAGAPAERCAALEALRVAVSGAGASEARPEGESPGAAGSPGTAWLPGAAEPPARPEEPGSAARPRRTWWWAAAASAAGVAAVAAALALNDGGSERRPEAASATTGTDRATAQATALCEAAGCVGKDPQASGCGSDATTIATANVRQMTIYVRYSHRCRTAWAKLTDATAGYRATITNSAGQSQTALVHWGYDAYSPMVDASQNDSRIQVCGDQPDNSRNCTPVIMDPATAPVVAVPTPAASSGDSPTLAPAPGPTPAPTPAPTLAPTPQ